jgi:hypothetical protein
MNLLIPTPSTFSHFGDPPFLKLTISVCDDKLLLVIQVRVAPVPSYSISPRLVIILTVPFTRTFDPRSLGLLPSDLAPLTSSLTSFAHTSYLLPLTH